MCVLVSWWLWGLCRLGFFPSSSLSNFPVSLLCCLPSPLPASLLASLTFPRMSPRLISPPHPLGSHSEPLYPCLFPHLSPDFCRALPVSTVCISLPVSLGLSFCSHFDPISVGLFPGCPVSLSSPPLYLSCPHYPPPPSTWVSPSLYLIFEYLFLCLSPCLCLPTAVSLSYLSLVLLLSPRLRVPPPPPVSLPGPALRGRPAGPAGDARCRWPRRPSGPH